MNRISFADHEQRLLMDGCKNITEAMLDDCNEVAENISKSHPELEKFYQECLKKNQKELLQERIYQNGYSPDDFLDEELQDLLDSM